jgi:DNA-binding NtrC family response regulator
VRIVAATNRNLEEQVQTGKFRADLMYRLKVFQITIPPLCARTSDIALLAQHFLALLATRYARPALLLDDSAMAALMAHHWPGNVRELRNTLERAVLLQHTGTLSAADLALPPPRSILIENAPAPASTPSAVSLDAMERDHLLHALQACNWNVTQAARKLDISRDTLRYRMDRHGLQK